MQPAHMTAGKGSQGGQAYLLRHRLGLMLSRLTAAPRRMHAREIMIGTCMQGASCWGLDWQRARSAGCTEEEADAYEWNARTQLSVWGTSDAGGSEVEDYANKQWAGLMSSYYRPR